MSSIHQLVQSTRPHAEKIRNLKNAVSSLFVGKDEIVHLMCVCTAAREPLLLVGEPGTAKSDLVVQWCDFMGVRRGHDTAGQDGPLYFEFLLTPFTEPGEVFGPVKIDDYTRKQVYSRNSRGMLQEASIAFLDEVFKANSAILNSLLTILNERKFYDAGVAIRVPLVVLFGATNEVPSSDDLAALFDRFTLRAECMNLRTDEHMRELVRLGTQRERTKSLESIGQAKPITPGAPMPRLDDFTAIFKAAADIIALDDFLQSHALFIEKFLRKVKAIRQDRLTRLNDRKVIKILKLMVVNALLEGRDVNPTDYRVLEHTWDNPYARDERLRLQEIAREE